MTLADDGLPLGAPRADDDLYRLPLGYDSRNRLRFGPPYASLIVASGAPRTGKTRGVAAPIAAAWPGSAIIVSVRGDLFDLTHLSRAERGPVAVFDPTGILGALTERCHWNVLDRCKDLQFAIQFAEHITESAMSTATLREGAYWYVMARKLIAPMLFAAAINGYTVSDVVRWIQTHEQFEVQSLLDAHRSSSTFSDDARHTWIALGGRHSDGWAVDDPHPDPDLTWNDGTPIGAPPLSDEAWDAPSGGIPGPPEIADIPEAPDVPVGLSRSEASVLALQMASSIWECDDRVRSSIYATADASMAGFELPAVAAAVQDGIEVEEFLDQPGATLYVIVPSINQSLYAPIVTALLGVSLDGAVARAERTNRPARTLVLLDEAGNVGQVPSLSRRSMTSMGHGIAMVSLFHDVSQMRRIYGPDEAQTILGAHHTLLALRGVDPNAGAMLDSRIGDEPDPSLPRGSGVTRLRRIPAGHAICMIGGDDPELLRLPSIDDDPLLRLELGL